MRKFNKLAAILCYTIIVYQGCVVENYDQERSISHALRKSTYENEIRSQQGSISSFQDKKLQNFWINKDYNVYDKKFKNNIFEILNTINKAKSLYDLRSNLNPGMKQKFLKNGQISLRVNNQYRLCFNWDKNNKANNLWFGDYHIG